MNPKLSCKNCIAWRATNMETEAGHKIGHCHMKAPSADSEGYADFPMTNTSQWCMEFKSDKPKAAPVGRPAEFDEAVMTALKTRVLAGESRTMQEMFRVIAQDIPIRYPNFQRLIWKFVDANKLVHGPAKGVPIKFSLAPVEVA